MSDSASRSRRWKWALSFALVLPPAALLALAVPRAAHRGSVREISCWVLPNLRVMATPGNEACPIGSRQAIARADQGELVPIRDHADLHAAVSQAGPQLRRRGRDAQIDAEVHPDSVERRLDHRRDARLPRPRHAVQDHHSAGHPGIVVYSCRA